MIGRFEEQLLIGCWKEHFARSQSLSPTWSTDAPWDSKTEICRSVFKVRPREYRRRIFRVA